MRILRSRVMRSGALIIVIWIAIAINFMAGVAWAENGMDNFENIPAASSSENRGESPVENNNESDQVEKELKRPKWTFEGFGFNYMELSGVSPKLAEILDDERRTVGLLAHFSEKYTSNLSLDAFMSYSQLGDLLLGNLLVGVKYDLSAFPKTFFTPWGGIYLSVNHLDDRSYVEPGTEQEEDWQVLGLGAAVAVGISMRLGKDFMVQLSARKNRFGALGVLESGMGVADRMTATEYSLAIVLIGDPQKEVMEFEEW